EQRVPESDPELVVREQAETNWRGHEPEFQGRLLEEDSVLVRTAPRGQPVPDFQDPIDAEGVDGLVALDVSAAEVDEERQAEEREHESQPGPAQAHSLTQVTSDQIRGMLTFSIEIGSRSAWARNAGRSRSDLKPMCTVKGEIARSIEASSGLRLRKWLRKMMRPPGRHTRPISRATVMGSGTTLIKYGAYTMSNAPSAKRRSAAFISSRRMLLMSLRATRSRAFSSMDPDRSIPVTMQSRGYSPALIPVPTPTSSTRSPGRIPIR